MENKSAKIKILNSLLNSVIRFLAAFCGFAGIFVFLFGHDAQTATYFLALGIFVHLLTIDYRPVFKFYQAEDRSAGK